MDKLIQTIQDEINNLMKSKFAQTTDNRLAAMEKKTVASKPLVEKIIQQYYESGKTLRQLCDENGVSISSFKKQRKVYSLEFKTGYKKDYTNMVTAIKTKNQMDEKEKDIQSGMLWKEYQLKWGVTETAYYKLKKNVKKDLAD